MKDITCPNCNKAFKIDEAGYADIVKQVRDSEFNRQLQERLELASKDKLLAVKEAVEGVEKERDGLQAKLDSYEISKELEIKQAVEAISMECNELKNMIHKLETVMKQ